MTLILDQLPYSDQYDHVDVGREYVSLAPHQIIIWVSLSIRDLLALPSDAPRFPAILDTGNNFGFALSERHLVHWAGSNRNDLPQLSRISVNRVSVPRLEAALWVHRNQKGERDTFRKAPAFRLDLRDGIAVFPVEESAKAPRLPLVGLRAIDENRLQTFVYGDRLRVVMRTPPSKKPRS